MIAVTRYYLALLGHSQRYLPPALAFLLVLAVQYTDRGAPVLPEFAVSAGALFVVACWLTVATVAAEDPVQRLLTLSHARRLSTVVGGIGLAVAVCCAGLTVLSGAIAAVVHGGLTDLGAGALAHLACAAAGIAVGLPCSRLLVSRLGVSLIAAILVLAAVLLLRWIPLLNPMLRSMATGTATPANLLPATLAALLVLLVSATAVTVLTSRRS